jgi:LysM repeat protein
VKVLKVIKVFVIVVVVCLALFGAYKIFKPAPVIDVSHDDAAYLEQLGINVAEGGKASGSGASPLFGDIEGVLPLDSKGTGNTAFQTPPASLGVGANTIGSPAPPFNSPAPPFNSPAPPFDSSAPSFNSPAPSFNSPAPPFDSSASAPPSNSPAPPFGSSAPLFDSPAPPFNPSAVPSNPLPNDPNTDSNTAPVWDHRQETINAAFPSSGIYPSNSAPQPQFSTSNPPLTASLPAGQVEPQAIAPSPPYASQHVAPSLSVPISVTPPIDTAPVYTVPVDRQPPPPFQPSERLPESPTVFPFNATELPNSTLPNQPAIPASESPKLMSTSVSLLPPVGNQTLTPPTPAVQVDPPPSPPAEAATNLDSQTSTTSSGLPPAFVNTGLRDDSVAINQTDDYQYKPIANSFVPTTQNQTTPESTTFISNDPNYYSSSVLIDSLLASTSSPQQANILSSPETVTIETATVEAATQESEFSSNILSSAFQNSGDKFEGKSEDKSEVKSNGKILVKLLPLVVESSEQEVIVDTNGRYIQPKSNSKNIADKETSKTNLAGNVAETPAETSENGLSLWSDYLKSVKQNNEAVLAPVREVVGDVSAKVAFAKEEPSGAGNFNPSYGSSSSDIFPAYSDSVVVDGLPNNLPEQISKANRESPFTDAPSSPSGVVATSSSMLIDNAMADLYKEKSDKKDKDKDNGLTTGLSNPANINGSERDLRVNDAQAVLKFAERNTEAQHREAVVQGRSLSPTPASVDKRSEVKFDGVVDDSASVTTMPFVQPPPAPQPVMVTSDLTNGDIFADNKPHEHSPSQSLPQPASQFGSQFGSQSVSQPVSQSTSQAVREMVLRFVKEQLREYGTRENAKMHVALVQLSKFYDRQDLNDVERDHVAEALDKVALEVIYSSKCHVLEPAYRVKAGDTTESIAKQFDISPALLSKINGLNPAEQLTAGKELKVVHGQFDAKVHTKRGELTLLLGGVYAGRFPVTIGRNILNVNGEFVVQNKTISKSTKTLTLNNNIELNGLNRRIGQNALGVSQENIEELFDILTENSVIVLED